MARKKVNDARTPAAWAQGCLAAAQALDPRYALNPLVELPRVELLRPHPSGLTASLAFVQAEGTWSLSFALLLSTTPQLRARTPLAAGSRFDPSRAVWRQVLDTTSLWRGPDPARRPPDGLWSAGEWRSNTLDLVARGLPLPEELLAKPWLEALRAGAPRLVALLGRAEVLVPDVARALERVAAPGEGARERVAEAFPHGAMRGRAKLPSRDRLEPEWLEVAREVEAAAACGVDPDAHVLALKVGQVDALDVARGALDAHPLDAAIAAQVRCLLPDAERLPALTALARSLA